MTANNVAVDRKWEFYNNFDVSPGTSVYAESRAAANDEIHVAISDATGEITGTKGAILETFPNVSKASDALKEDGSSNYYKDVINQTSAYVWFLNQPGSSLEHDGDWSGEGGNDREFGNTAFYLSLIHI